MSAAPAAWADDPGAVVDSAGRVRGIDGLRVADASVMPTVPRANTNIPTIMIAEKLAATIGPRRATPRRAAMKKMTSTGGLP